MKPIPQSNSGEYRCCMNLDLYDSPNCDVLATQAAMGRHLRILSTCGERSRTACSERSRTATKQDEAILVCSCEDDYEAWLPVDKIAALEPAEEVYRAIAVSRSQIEQHLPQIIAFALQAEKQPNYYLWGGNVGPNYDCSGLIQAAFAHYGIWLPRDSYQQEGFTHAIAVEELLPGDLIFFGTKEKVNHVALHLGDLYYIHSSSPTKGRNGIGRDRLDPEYHEVSKSYYQTLWGCGRIMSNYIPK